jgi:hypothetical protein
VPGELREHILGVRDAAAARVRTAVNKLNGRQQL